MYQQSVAAHSITCDGAGGLNSLPMACRRHIHEDQPITSVLFFIFVYLFAHGKKYDEMFKLLQPPSSPLSSLQPTYIYIYIHISTTWMTNKHLAAPIIIHTTHMPALSRYTLYDRASALDTRNICRSFIVYFSSSLLHHHRRLRWVRLRILLRRRPKSQHSVDIYRSVCKRRKYFVQIGYLCVWVCVCVLHIFRTHKMVSHILRVLFVRIWVDILAQNGSERQRRERVSWVGEAGGGEKRIKYFYTDAISSCVLLLVLRW